MLPCFPRPQTNTHSLLFYTSFITARRDSRDRKKSQNLKLFHFYSTTTAMLFPKIVLTRMTKGEDDKALFQKVKKKNFVLSLPPQFFQYNYRSSSHWLTDSGPLCKEAAAWWCALREKKAEWKRTLLGARNVVKISKQPQTSDTRTNKASNHCLFERSCLPFFPLVSLN